jgi:hypothetical protein
MKGKQKARRRRRRCGYYFSSHSSIDAEIDHFFVSSSFQAKYFFGRLGGHRVVIELPPSVFHESITNIGNIMTRVGISSFMANDTK